MGLVLYALKNRVTFYVMGVLILLAGIGTSAIAPKDTRPPPTLGPRNRRNPAARLYAAASLYYLELRTRTRR